MGGGVALTVQGLLGVQATGKIDVSSKGCLGSSAYGIGGGRGNSGCSSTNGAYNSAGGSYGGDGKHPITPVMLGDEKLAVDMASALREQGIYVRGFTYPVVPMGKARIRVQISTAHTREQMDHAIGAFEKVGKEKGVIK